ncbi:MAG: 2-oxoacid:acceptor oxidoreductase family protein [Endomicrobia bacterium]|nr:2-oxoacid:acceptor oxidoreductase family protein [Endomicrobiia bacterium]MCX7940435.1 2-oxoacid:acceptor oxidoreductase family protein [Endomicrobiia bacterium]MDW8055872.1 2-oxoacid:acceptor oxidoreductase family protein [Elusimicrobiota bacterium]
MYEEIFIAGSGGQGVLTIGRLIALSAADEDKYVTYYPSYGAEIRGGTANCMVKISSNFIYSPIIEIPSITIIMNMPSYVKFINKLLPSKFLFLNSSLIDEITKISDIYKEKSLKIFKISATDIANKIGSSVVANIIMLGAVIKATKIIENINTVKNVIVKNFKEKFWELNFKALNAGMETV